MLSRSIDLSQQRERHSLGRDKECVCQDVMVKRERGREKERRKRGRESNGHLLIEELDATGQIKKHKLDLNG